MYKKVVLIKRLQYEIACKEDLTLAKLVPARDTLTYL